MTALSPENKLKLGKLLNKIGDGDLIFQLDLSHDSWFQLCIESIPDIIFPENNHTSKHKKFCLRSKMMEYLDPYGSANVMNKQYYFHKPIHPVDILIESYEKYAKKSK